jgi:hypothetical protein
MYYSIFLKLFLVFLKNLTERGHSTIEVDARLAELKQQEQEKQTAVNTQLKTA